MHSRSVVAGGLEGKKFEIRRHVVLAAEAMDLQVANRSCR